MGVKISLFAPSLRVGCAYWVSGLAGGAAGRGRPAGVRNSDGDGIEYTFLGHRGGLGCARSAGALDHCGMRHGF